MHVAGTPPRLWDSVPYCDSLSALALLGMRTAGADGYAYFEKHAETGALRRLSGCGAEVSECVLALGCQGAGVLEYPLRTQNAVDGLLVFVFSKPPKSLASRTGLNRIAASIARLWEMSNVGDDYLELIARIRNIEAKVADAKIADRTRGYLQGDGQDAGECIVQHAEHVLSRAGTRSLMERHLAELEEELDERRVVAQAKSILQSTAGLSEEKAHAQLLATSRRTRKKLRESALQVIETNSLVVGGSHNENT